MPNIEQIQKRTLLVLAISQVIGTVGVGVAPTIGVLLAGDVTDSEAWAGLARTASTLGAALFGLPLGNLASRRGRRVALSSGWWIAGVGAATLVVAAQWSLVVPLFLGLLLIGAGSAVTLQARFAATDLAEPQKKGKALSLVVWVGTLGMILGPNMGTPGEVIGRSTGLTVYAASFLIASAFFILAGTVVFLWLRPDPLLVLEEAPGGVSLQNQNNTGRPVSKSSIWTRLHQLGSEFKANRKARYAVVAILTAQVVMVALMTMTPVHLAHHGDSITIIGLTISLHIAGMYALAPLVGMLSDRFGPRLVIAVGIAVFFGSLIVAGVIPDSTVGIVVSLILLGVGWSFVNIAGSAQFSQSVSPVQRATAQGGVDALSNLCGAIAAFAAGPLLVLTSFSVLAWISVGLLVPLTVMTARGSNFGHQAVGV